MLVYEFGAGVCVQRQCFGPIATRPFLQENVFSSYSCDADIFFINPGHFLAEYSPLCIHFEHYFSFSDHFPFSFFHSSVLYCLSLFHILFPNGARPLDGNHAYHKHQQKYLRWQILFEASKTWTLAMFYFQLSCWSFSEVLVLCSLVRRVPFENERPLACWDEDDLGISICLAPVLVCAEASPF